MVSSERSSYAGDSNVSTTITTPDGAEPQERNRLSSARNGALDLVRRWIRMDSHESEECPLPSQQLGSIREIVVNTLQEHNDHTYSQDSSADHTAPSAESSREEIDSSFHEQREDGPSSPRQIRNEVHSLFHDEASLVPHLQTNLVIGSPPRDSHMYRGYSHQILSPGEILPRAYETSSSPSPEPDPSLRESLQHFAFPSHDQGPARAIPPSLRMTPISPTMDPAYRRDRTQESPPYLGPGPIPSSQLSSSSGSSNDFNTSYRPTPYSPRPNHSQGWIPSAELPADYDFANSPSAHPPIPSRPSRPRTLLRHTTGRPPTESPEYAGFNHPRFQLEIDATRFPTRTATPHPRPADNLARLFADLQANNEPERSRSTTPNGHHMLSRPDSEHQMLFPMSPAPSPSNRRTIAAHSDLSIGLHLDTTRRRRSTEHGQGAREIDVERFGQHGGEASAFPARWQPDDARPTALRRTTGFASMLRAETRERSGRHANAVAHAHPPASRGQSLDRGMGRRTSREDVVWFRKYDWDPEWK